MQKINVLMVLGNTGRGGAQTFAVNVLRMIDRTQFQIDFAVNDIRENGYTQEIYDLGSKIYKVPFFRGFNIYEYKKTWRSILVDNKIDIIHGNVSSTASIYLKEAHRHGCKTIVHSHSAGYRGNRFEQIVKRTYTMGAKKQADYWFACSKLAAIRLFGKHYEEYDDFYYIPNAIITDNYQFNQETRIKIRKQLGINGTQKLYGHVGSFSIPKNHYFLLNVFKQIKKFDNQAMLILLGDGDLKAEIQLQIKELGIMDSIIMVGNVGNVNEYLMAMDMMIFPSLFEGFPMSVLEAQAAGLPIVLSDTITDEVILTDSVVPVSLNRGEQYWAKMCQDIHVDDRYKMNHVVKQSKYDMGNCVNLLMSLYKKMLDKK